MLPRRRPGVRRPLLVVGRRDEGVPADHRLLEVPGALPGRREDLIVGVHASDPASSSASASASACAASPGSATSSSRLRAVLLSKGERGEGRHTTVATTTGFVAYFREVAERLEALEERGRRE